MTKISKLYSNTPKEYIKCYYNNNCIINKPEHIPINCLPADYSRDNYTVLEKQYILLNNSFSDFYIESCYDKCYLCKCNINYHNIKIKYKLLEKSVPLNENIFEKLENILVNNKNNNNLFIYQSNINSDSHIYFYYHLCETCYKHSLYYWSISHENKYPSSRVDGYRFINENDRFVPEIKKSKSIEIINKLDIPNIYVCDSYIASQNSYNYLNYII
jgi:hypothetical protein